MNEDGFTLIEGLLAIFLLGVVLTGVLPGFLTFLDANTASEETSDAVAARREQIQSRGRDQARDAG